VRRLCQYGPLQSGRRVVKKFPRDSLNFPARSTTSPEIFSMATLSCTASTRPFCRMGLILAGARTNAISIYPHLRPGRRAEHSSSMSEGTPPASNPALAPAAKAPEPARSAGNSLWEPVTSRMEKHIRESRLAGPASMFSSTMRSSRSIIAKAAYVIPEDMRKQGRVQRLEDGEEVGESRGPWHECSFPTPTRRRPRCG
jgi:hypothetical protein